MQGYSNGFMLYSFYETEDGGLKGHLENTAHGSAGCAWCGLALAFSSVT